MPRDVPNQLNDVSQVVFVPGVVLTRVRLKEIVSRGHLKGHAGGRPDVGGRAIARTKEDLQTAVLASLDVFGEVVVLRQQRRIRFALFSKKNLREFLSACTHHPAGVSQVGNLDLQLGTHVDNGIQLLVLFLLLPV